MWLLIPVISALCHIAASRPESMDFVDQNYGEILFPRDSSSQSKNLPAVKEFPSRSKQIVDAKDQQEWNKHNYNNFDANTRKTSRFNDDETLDNSDIPDNDIDEVQLKQLTGLLTILLQQPEWGTPMIVLEDISEDFTDDSDEDLSDPETQHVFKRSRYYRRYPWKRQNTRLRSSFDYESPYLCTPSREDVYQLLVALHEVRQGNKSRTVKICHRQRPVSTVFTNIRFLGRRK